MKRAELYAQPIADFLIAYHLFASFFDEIVVASITEPWTSIVTTSVGTNLQREI